LISQVPAGGPAESPDGQALWPVRSGVVPQLADGFSTRPESAPRLGAALVPGSAVVLVPGRGGGAGSRDWLGSCGKTQLAAFFAESLWRSREVDLMVWVPATSRASVLAGYAEAAEAALGTDPSADAEAIAERLVSWLGETRRRWLVVLDDLTGAADLTGLWPAGPAGQVLITATSPAVLPAEHRALVLQVGAFSSREALSYLMGRLTADPDQRLGAIDLVEDLGCEPMALAQASGVIATSSLSCRDYQGYFTARRDQLATTAGSKPPAAAVSWLFSVEQADRLAAGGAAQPVLALAALLDGHGMPATVFSSPAAGAYLAPDGAARPAARELAWNTLPILERTALLALDRSASPPTARMSPVIQAAIRAVMPDAMRDRAVRAAADALVEAWPAEEPPWLAAMLRSCTASLQQHAGNMLLANGCHPLLLRAGQSLVQARLTGSAVGYWRDLAAASEAILGPGHPDTKVIDGRLADAYLAAGQAAEAVAWFQRVLAGRVTTLGAGHPGTVAARRDLGQALIAAGQPAEAVTVLEGAVGDYDRVLGPDHPETISAREELAAAYRAAGRLSDAIPLYRRTLADRERVQGARHPDALSTRQQLADTYLADGKLKDATSHYKKVLADRERVLGPDHMDTIAARGNLGSAYHSAGKMASAVHLYEQTCDSYQRVAGPDHPDTLARCANLASAYYSVGRLTDALTLLRDTLSRCERILPPGDPLTAAVRESLTNLAGSGPAAH
jgi:tetratricopeptide (TPR) repeat protein